jgi:cyclopropane fatty-acyl-phospholipid synthase-like methyltransferase
MRRSQTLGAAYFERLYQASPDPWRFAESRYEAAKYGRTIEALGTEPVARALEVGCSIGVLTRRLAALCDRLVATDVARAPLQTARERCRDLANVTFRLVRTAVENFTELFDLIVLSEVVYYWDDDDLAAVAVAINRSLAPGGRLLLVHWIGKTDYPKSADEAVGALWMRLPGMEREHSERRDLYRLDLWRRPNVGA